MKLHNLLDIELLAHHVNEGNVSRRVHPDSPALCIFNYTAQCQYRQEWDNVTRQCRGLIVDFEQGAEVLARPFPKFYNHNEPLAPAIDAPPDIVTVKADGSLGIGYVPPHSGIVHVATRGSFSSEQALWANSWLGETYPGWHPNPGITYLWEIIYPENKIVVDYDAEGLVLLEGIDLETGERVDAVDLDWPGEIIQSWSTDSLDDLAEQVNQLDNFEGVVCYWSNSQDRVKIKAEQYKELHKLVFGLSSRSVWEALSSGEDMELFVSSLPDEFHEFCSQWIKSLTLSFREIEALAESTYQTLLEEIPDAAGTNRAEYAQRAKDFEWPNLLFGLLDGKDMSGHIWALVKPELVRFS